MSLFSLNGASDDMTHFQLEGRPFSLSLGAKTMRTDLASLSVPQSANDNWSEVSHIARGIPRNRFTSVSYLVALQPFAPLEFPFLAHKEVASLSD